MSRPAARIEVDGADISTQLLGGAGVLVSLTITDEAGIKSDRLEMEIDDRESFPAPRVGMEIKAWLGYEPQPVYMGTYKVDEWTKRGPLRTLSVTARAAELTTEIRAAKSKSWDDMSVGQIAQKIAKAHGLGTSLDGAFATTVIPHIDQQGESDLGFLSRLAKRVGATFKLADGKIVMAEKGSGSLPSGQAKEVILLKPDMVIDWTATSQARGDYKSVKAGYMDHAKGKRVFVEEGSGKPIHRDRRLYASEAEAKAAAKAQYGELKRGKVQFEINSEGVPDVFAEAIVQAQDFDPDVDGEYLIKTVTHTLDGSGYRTSLSMETKGAKDTEATPSE